MYKDESVVRIARATMCVVLSLLLCGIASAATVADDSYAGTGTEQEKTNFCSG